MSHVPMIFQFQDSRSAALAYSTLIEIGYHTHRTEEAGQAIVQVFVERSELTSALEITQAYGGELMAAEPGTTEHPAHDPGNDTSGNVYSAAYAMDMIPIPAHLVNEELEGQVDSGIGDEGAIESSESSSSADFDPSGKDYDGFEAGVHL
jgi:hypothetical protein